MQNIRLLIAGVDPGTTVGVAVLGMDGELIKVFSGRAIPANELIASLTALGRTAIICTDKKNVPAFVQNIAVKLGARVMAPKEDMKVLDKRSLTIPYSCRNDHESDALASALSCYSQLKYLIRRIDRACDMARVSERLRERVMQMVLVKENIPIYTAILLVTKPEVQEAKAIREIIEDKGADPAYMRLIRRISSLENDIRYLRKSNNRYRKEIERSNNKKPENRDRQLSNKESTILQLSSMLKRSAQRQRALEESLVQISGLISKPDKIEVIRKLTSIDSLDTQAKRIYLLDSRWRNKELDEIQKHSICIIYEGDLQKKYRERFHCIPKSRLKILLETDEIIIADKARLKKAIGAGEMLKMLLDNYRQSRAERT